MEIFLIPKMDETVEYYRTAMTGFSSPFHSYMLSNSAMKKNIDMIGEWISGKQEKEKAGADSKQRIEHVGKVLTDTVNAYVAFDTFENGNPSEITSATLDLSWTVAGLYGGPYRAAIVALYSVIGTIASANKPDEKSIIETLDDSDLWNDCTQLFLGKLSQRF